MQPVQNINKSKASDNFQQDWSKKVDLVFDQSSQPPKTRGEKIFNGLSWALFGWLANAIVSVQLADTLENRFRPFYKKYGQKMAESPLFTTFFKTPEQKVEANKLAHSLASVIALLPGGYSVLIPIKLMEDRKTQLVRTFDDWFGPKNPDDNTKQLIDARHSYLDAAPKLNWGDMIKGRTLPVLGIVGTHFAFASDKTNIVNLATGKDTFKGFNHYIEKTGNALYQNTTQSKYNWVRSTTDKSTQRLDRGMQRYIAKNGPDNYTDKGVQRTGTDRLKGYMTNISVDLLYSAIVAVETFIIGHVSAFKRENKNEVKRAVEEGRLPTPHKFQLDQTPQAETAPAVAASDTPTTTLDSARYDNRLTPVPLREQHA